MATGAITSNPCKKYCKSLLNLKRLDSEDGTSFIQQRYYYGSSLKKCLS